MSGARRWLSLALILFVAFLVNFPLAHATWLRSQVQRSGVEVVATVTDARSAGGDYLVVFTVPADEGRAEFEGAIAQVDRATYADARSSRTLDVRVLPDDGGVFIVDGEVRGRFGLVVTLLADLFLVAVVLLALRFHAVMRVELVLRATQDLERCPPGPRLDRLEGQRYLVSGDVAEIADGEVVLDLGDRRVRVLLDGHTNPAGHQQPVRAIGYMVA